MKMGAQDNYFPFTSRLINETIISRDWQEGCAGADAVGEFDTIAGTPFRSMPFAREKPGADWKMDLQTRGAGRKSRRRPTLVVGMKPNGKSRMKSLSPFQFLAGAFVLAICLISGAQAQYLFVASYNGNTIEQFDASGNSTILSSPTLNRPSGLALDSDGNLYVANYTGNNIVKFDTNGNSTNFASSGLVNPYALAFGPDGALYAANYNGNSIEQFDSHGTGTVFASLGVKNPVGLAFDGASNLFVANFGNNTIEKIDSTGHGTQFATNISGSLSGPFGLAFDRQTNLYVANFSGGNIEKFDAAGNGTIHASSLNHPTGLAFDGGGNLYVTSFIAN